MQKAKNSDSYFHIVIYLVIADMELKKIGEEINTSKEECKIQNKRMNEEEDKQLGGRQYNTRSIDFKASRNQCDLLSNRSEIMKLCKQGKHMEKRKKKVKADAERAKVILSRGSTQNIVPFSQAEQVREENNGNESHLVKGIYSTLRQYCLGF